MYDQNRMSIPHTIGNVYSFGTGTIEFQVGKVKTTWGMGTFAVIDARQISIEWNRHVHILTFSKDYTKFISIRKHPDDLNCIRGCLYNPRIQRIALLYYGRIRHFDALYKNTRASIGSAYAIDIFYSSDNEKLEEIQKFVKLYRPISINNDAIVDRIDFTKYPYPDKHPYTNYDNMSRHFINKKRVFHLLEQYKEKTSTVYDIVLATRLDLQFDTFYIPTPEQNTLYIPEGEDHSGINDRFAMGDTESMKKYMNLYDTCEYILENRLAKPHPEQLALANIKHHTLTVKRVDIHCELVR